MVVYSGYFDIYMPYLQTSATFLHPLKVSAAWWTTVGIILTRRLSHKTTPINKSSILNFCSFQSYVSRGSGWYSWLGSCMSVADECCVKPNHEEFWQCPAQTNRTKTQEMCRQIAVSIVPETVVPNTWPRIISSKAITCGKCQEHLVKVSALENTDDFYDLLSKVVPNLWATSIAPRVRRPRLNDGTLNRKRLSKRPKTALTDE